MLSSRVLSCDATLSGLYTDDFAELARVEQKRSMAASRSQPHKADPALLAMFASTMQLAQKGKITHKNAFQLQLIDHMADIIQQPDDADAATSQHSHTPLKANKRLASATGTPLSTAAALASPPARSPASTQSDASPSSALLSPVDGRPATLSDITNQQKRRPAKPQVNFVKASSTLDASVMIYSGRVDNVHKDAYRMAGGLSAQQLERAEEEAEVDAEDESAQAASRARKKRRAATTIETKLSNINMREVERREDGDPFFKRMSAAFDAGGAKGLLTYQLSVYRGAEMALDGQLAVMEDRAGQTAAVEGLTQNFDMTELSELLQTTASNWRQLTVCPLMRELEAIRNELQGKPKQTEEDDSTSESDNAAIQSENASPEALQSDEELSGGIAGLGLADSDCVGAVAVGVDLNELHAEIDAAIQQEECLDSHMAGGMDECDDEDDSVATSASGAPSAAASNTAFLFMAPGLFGAPSDSPSIATSHSLQMAGMAHWKFKSAPATLAASTQRQPRQTRATVPIDFSAAVAPSTFAIVPSKRLSTLRLSAATLRKRMEPNARAALMRPTAATYRVEGLMRLYGRASSVSIRARPDEKSEEPKPAEEENAAADGAGAVADGWDDMGGDDEDGTAAAHAMDSTPVADAASRDGNADFTLLTKPKQVEQLSIGYAQVAKRVDVRKLKNCLWSGMSAATDDKASDERHEPSSGAAIAPTTFQRAIDSLAGQYPARQLEAVSVSYCFICVLHLCNEHGLTLESDPLPSSADGEAADRRLNLGSFTIRSK